MAYCTQADLENEAGGAEALRQLSDFDKDGVADAGVIADHIARVSRWIDGYARARYPVPFTAEPIPTEIRDLAIAETLYRIRKSRRSPTDDEREDHAERVEWLKDVAAGRVRIALEAEKPSQAGSAEAGERASATGEFDSPDFGGLW
jgi:phage gp36-like protein